MGAVEDILISDPKIISVSGGDVLHAMKNLDLGYKGFGEAYFSRIEFGAIKAWKRHLRMTLNLVVPVGRVLFHFVDERGGATHLVIGPSSYKRLTVPPGIWFGFKGLDVNGSLLLNIADIPHELTEVQRKDASEIQVNWEE
jgi:dTDP-4-dehydrorhamnose 3,5-epimerase